MTVLATGILGCLGWGREGGCYGEGGNGMVKWRMSDALVAYPKLKIKPLLSHVLVGQISRLKVPGSGTL